MNPFARESRWLLTGFFLIVVATFVLVVFNMQFIGQISSWMDTQRLNELNRRSDELETIDTQLHKACRQSLLSWGRKEVVDPHVSQLWRGRLVCDATFEAHDEYNAQNWMVPLSDTLMDWLKGPVDDGDFIEKLKANRLTENTQEMYRQILLGRAYRMRGEETLAVQVFNAVARDYPDRGESVLANVAVIELGLSLSEEVWCQTGLERLLHQAQKRALDPTLMKYLRHRLKEWKPLKSLVGSMAGQLDDLLAVQMRQMESGLNFRELWRRDRQQLAQAAADEVELLLSDDKKTAWFLVWDDDMYQYVVGALDVEAWSDLLKKRWMTTAIDESPLSLVVEVDGTLSEDLYKRSFPLTIPQFTAYLGTPRDDEIMASIVQQRTATGTIVVLVAVITLGLGVMMAVKTALHFQSLSRLKTSFVSTVSYELRTPLTSIQMFVETLKDRRYNTEDEREEYIRIIDTETIRLKGLIERLLMFSSLEQNKRLSLSFESVSLNRVIEHAVELVQPQFEAAGMTLHTHLPEEELGIVGDGNAMTDVILNLLGNAIKYAQSGKEATIELQRENDEAVIRVMDRGPGIPKSERKRLFGAFVRQDNALTREQEGAGLGLALVKQVMTTLGGSVRILSREGGGGVFELRFPLDLS